MGCFSFIPLWVLSKLPKHAFCWSSLSQLAGRKFSLTNFWQGRKIFHLRCSRTETFSILNCVFLRPLPMTNIAWSIGYSWQVVSTQAWQSWNSYISRLRRFNSGIVAGDKHPSSHPSDKFFRDVKIYNCQCEILYKYFKSDLSTSSKIVVTLAFL